MHSHYTQQLFSAITDVWTVVIVVYSVMSGGSNAVWIIGGSSDSAVTKACLLHTILFLSVLTTQVCTHTLLLHACASTATHTTTDAAKTVHSVNPQDTSTEILQLDLPLCSVEVIHLG
jgi:hypothetical protein